MQGSQLLTPNWWIKRMRREWAWLRIWWQPPRDPEGFQQAEQWAENYGAPRDLDDGTYALTLEYAKDRYAELVEVSEALDKKLDELARMALAVGAIVATAARVLGLDSSFIRSPIAATSICCSVATLITAAVARRPNLSWKPMNSRTLLEIADLEPNLPKYRVEAATAASYHSAMIGITAIVEWKAELMKRATWLFCFSVVLIAILIVWPSVKPLTSSQVSAQTSGLSPSL